MCSHKWKLISEPQNTNKIDGKYEVYTALCKCILCDQEQQQEFKKPDMKSSGAD